MNDLLEYSAPRCITSSASPRSSAATSSSRWVRLGSADIARRSARLAFTLVIAVPSDRRAVSLSPDRSDVAIAFFSASMSAMRLSTSTTGFGTRLRASSPGTTFTLTGSVIVWWRRSGRLVYSNSIIATVAVPSAATAGTCSRNSVLRSSPPYRSPRLTTTASASAQFGSSCRSETPPTAPSCGLIRMSAPTTDLPSRSPTRSAISLVAASTSGANRCVPFPPRVIASRRTSSYPRPNPTVDVVTESAACARCARPASTTGSAMPAFTCPSDTTSTVAPTLPSAAVARPASRSPSR